MVGEALHKLQEGNVCR